MHMPSEPGVLVNVRLQIALKYTTNSPQKEVNGADFWIYYAKPIKRFQQSWLDYLTGST